MAVWGGFTKGMKRREVKSKGEEERYTHLNAEFQRIARRDKKPSSAIIAKEQRKTIERQRPEIFSRILEIPREHLEKAMATHSSTFAWKIPWTEEPGRLQSMGLLRVRHDWVTSFSLFTFIHWRRKWQPTPVSLPGESQGQGSLVGCHLWGRTELDTTEAT